jgi:hypothetical protein
MSGMEDKDLEDRINILVMETSANKYIKIVEENNMHFPDYEDICVQNAKKELFSFNIRQFMERQKKRKVKDD